MSLNLLEELQTTHSALENSLEIVDETEWFCWVFISELLPIVSSLLACKQQDFSCLSSFRFHQKMKSWAKTTSGPICPPRRMNYFGNKMPWGVRISKYLSTKIVGTTISPRFYIPQSLDVSKKIYLEKAHEQEHLIQFYVSLGKLLSDLHKLGVQ